MFLLVLLLLAGVGVYVMTPAERERLLRHLAGWAQRALGLARTYRVPGDDPFYAELRMRMRWALVTYAIAAVSATTFILALIGTGALDDPETLVAWGGNFGPRTTNGERWRILTSVFMHRGVLHLLVNLVVLVQLGLILERMVGRFTFGTIFLAGGALGSIASGAASPMSVSVGMTTAVFALYGLLGATVIRGLGQPHALRIPMRVLARMAPAAIVFALYAVASGEPALTAQVGLCAGLVGGVTLTRGDRDEAVRLRRVAALGAVTATIVLIAAMSVRAVTDVRPEIARVITNEERTAAVYDTAVAQFRIGRATTNQLAQIIDETILPSLQDARDRVAALVNVPPADAALVADAQEYLRLREEGWRARAAALRSRSMPALREADTAERAAMQHFDSLKSAASK
jgi:rhomboid protease GluP